MKPNTYTKLYVHCVFTPWGRESRLIEPVRVNVHKYIYGIIMGLDCYPVAINGTNDHVHILVGFRPVISVENLVRDIKRSTSLYINASQMVNSKFRWQEGYGAFTVGYPSLDTVYKYILNQQEHHKKGNFKKEYYALLTEQGVDFSSEHLYEFYDQD
jgi:REP-associated tyrosine transposase